MKQFKIVSMLTILTLMLTSLSGFAQEQQSNSNTSNNTKSGMVYQCTTHLKVISNVPGNCSICKMKLEEYTMDEAIENLSGGGHKKPELKNKRIYSGKEEKKVTEEITQEDVEADNEEKGLEEIDNEPQHTHSEEHIANVSKTDRNRDGKVYQCTMCPDQLSDESTECRNCGMELVKLTVEKAKKNIPICEH